MSGHPTKINITTEIKECIQIHIKHSMLTALPEWNIFSGQKELLTFSELYFAGFVVSGFGFVIVKLFVFVVGYCRTKKMRKFVKYFIEIFFLTLFSHY